jgi:ABC-type multidrug transport system fused ATPase/permease subunit
MKLKDKRMKITAETLNNIKILKLYSWENGFKNKINKAREEELINREKNYGIENLNSMIQWSGPIFTSLISIGLYQYFNEKFKIEDIFTILNLFNKIQGPLKYLPNLVNHFYETVISTERIEKFLKQEEINPDNIIKDYSDNKIKIKIENGNYSWGIPQGDDEKDDKNDKEKISKKKVKNNNKKFGKIYQEIELVEKIYIPEENDSNKKKKKKKKNKEDSYIELGKNETIEDNENIEDDDDDNTISIVNNTLVPVLKDINLVINKGEFVCIIGEVGSGKSSLIQSFLNCLIP